MGTAVVLVPEASGEVSVGPEAARRLADLGVTHDTLLRDLEGFAVVLNGWSFDPSEAVDPAIEALGCAGMTCRTLLPMAQMSLNGGPERSQAPR